MFSGQVVPASVSVMEVSYAILFSKLQGWGEVVVFMKMLAISSKLGEYEG